MIGTLLTLALGIVVVLIIIAANGYFVAQEFAYMSVDRTRLAAAARAGDASAQRALDVTRRTSFMLSGAQLGITVTGLLVGYVAEPMVGSALAELLGTTGIPTAVSLSIGTMLALLAATIIQMIFGELYPKNLAIANPDPLARGLARSTTIYLALFGWLITIFDRSANALLRLVGMEPVHDVDATATAKDLERIVEDSRASGDLPDELSVLIARSLEFPEQDVKHAMIPRAQVGVVRPDTTISQVRELMATGHSRYPIVSESEEPLGVVALTDVLGADLRPRDPVTTIMREPLVLPELMALPDALDRLISGRRQLACIIDEHGGLSGVLTVEDIAEEFVGELTDEHDDAPPPSITVLPALGGSHVAGADAPSPTRWRMDGDTPLDEVERAVGHDVPTGEYETVAGLVIAHYGALPRVGEVVTVRLRDDGRDLAVGDAVHRGLEITVLGVDRHVPQEVEVVLVEGLPGPEDDAATHDIHRSEDAR